MSKFSEETKRKIIELIKEGRLDRYQIARKTGVSPGTVSAIKANFTRGTYSEPEEMEEILDATETTFGLERDLKESLVKNLSQLEQGLKYEGEEVKTEAGRIDIKAIDKNENTVVIELKAGTADRDSVAQVLSYMGALNKSEKKRVRGIIVAADFKKNAILAAQMAGIELVKYSISFKFSSV